MCYRREGVNHASKCKEVRASRRRDRASRRCTKRARIIVPLTDLRSHAQLAEQYIEMAKKARWFAKEGPRSKPSAIPAGER